MCCVIPPASEATTDVSRIASSSVVLPWSTWPMIVTTGGRAASVSSASSKISGSSSSSPRCLIVTSRLSSVAISSTSSSVSDCVAVRISPRPIRILMISCIETPSACEKSRTVTPDSTTAGPVGGAIGWSLFGSRGMRSREPGARRDADGRRRCRSRHGACGPPAPWPRGRIGLFGRSAIARSVKAFQGRIDADGWFGACGRRRVAPPPARSS